MRKYITVSILFMMILHAACTRREVRYRVNFGNDWKFILADRDEFREPGFDDSGWRIISLPHDWSIEGEFSDKHPATVSGGALPGGIGWYRKTFSLDSKKAGKLFNIEFDGVYRNSEVWINGNYLGKS